MKTSNNLNMYFGLHTNKGKKMKKAKEHYNDIMKTNCYIDYNAKNPEDILN